MSRNGQKSLSNRLKSIGGRTKSTLGSWYRASVSWLRRHRKLIVWLIAGVIVVIVALLSVPYTRYLILGKFIQKDVTILVIDEITRAPVSDAKLQLGDISVDTDGDGEAVVAEVPVGTYDVTITKKYYADAVQQYTIPIFGDPANIVVKVKATGYQVPIRVVNNVTGEPLEGVTVRAGDTSVTSAASGEATMVLPPGDKPVDIAISLDGYLDRSASLAVGQGLDEQEFRLTPVGKVYYLSNASGVMNIMKSNYDGTAEEVLLAGTGNESIPGVSMSIAENNRYIALLADRDQSPNMQLHIIDTATGELRTVEKGKVSVSVIGWYGDTLAYSVYQEDLKMWDKGKVLLKTYSVASNKSLLIDQTEGSNMFGDWYGGALYQTVDPYVIGDSLYYLKTWVVGDTYRYNPLPEGMRDEVFVVKIGSTTKRSLFTYQTTATSGVRFAYSPLKEMYVATSPAQYDTPANWEYYVFSSGKFVKTDKMNDTDFSRVKYAFDEVSMRKPLSPDGKKLYWAYIRNGRFVHMVGNPDGSSAEDIRVPGDYEPYAWVSNEYLAVSKGGNELYVVSAKQPLKGEQAPLKVGYIYRISGAPYF